ncbi:MAG: peptidoglycan DD-metalloendopeptidase family protein [Gammaproteobacteria bacterium]|nr:peptidoglycan DD-metalloendopeptidase family protein [Gammaproteobacteria bacterium]NNF61087.1 peptidoglycan DD-metalloendopeptidase family protein [Gammaproteobacteria bacterium]NNM21400.1 peptidoglycan DD-metalloendopeptidase family protein [Gammaproteobacteria bacterium]
MSRAPSRIRHDYKGKLDYAGPARPRTSKWLLFGIVAAAAAATLYLTLLHDAGGTQRSQPKTAAVPAIELQQPEPETTSLKLRLPGESVSGAPVPSATTSMTLPLPQPRQEAAVVPATPVDAPDRVQFEIASGDTLDQLFAANKLNRSDLAEILQLDDAREHLHLLRPGDRISIRHELGDVLQLRRTIDDERALTVERDGENFIASMVVNPVEKRIAHAHGAIDSSLFLAAQKAGISDTLIMNLAGIFAWDIDFVLDIRSGDRFTMLYEEIWQDGEKLRDGKVLAAEFTNGGKTFRAIRFEDPDGEAGYFTPDGLNVKKAFLRAPIAISPRVTSSFNPRRMHPVHKKVLPHKGVDYSAPTGTAIKAAGDGKVIFRGRKGGYGNTVILQHGGNITTLYAHMSKFHSRARTGRRVRQGQVIGYSGATGTVTAAHLHYEYRVGGVHRNPRTVKLPKAQPVDKKYRALYTEVATPLIEQLDLVGRTLRVASSNPQ